jgi:hypothetical protein
MEHCSHHADPERQRGEPRRTRIARRVARSSRRLARVVATMLCLPITMQAAPTPARILYDLKIETSMPHLDENLRYATRYERTCVNPDDLSRQFPMLGDVSLRDCRLVDHASHDDAIIYTLQCSGGHGTTGRAVWHLDDRQIAGTLDVKLGGKNMTANCRKSTNFKAADAQA